MSRFSCFILSDQVGSTSSLVTGSLLSNHSRRIPTGRVVATLKGLLLLMLLPLTNAAFGQANAVLVFEQMQQQADMAYKNEDYARAFRLYQPLAEVGDKFSAYRIASMYATGLHVDQDLIEAYGWSYLAAETDIQSFRKYYDYIKKRLSVDQLQQARKRASELLMQHGIWANAVQSRKVLRTVLSKCAGSRVGNTCSKLRITWRGCNISNAETPFENGNPPESCLRLGSAGLTSYNAMPINIRAVQKGLAEVIKKYQPGQVELGDFGLIDEDAEPQDGEGN